jgi:hypothetical protein
MLLVQNIAALNYYKNHNISGGIMSPKLTLRKAEEQDVATILQMILDLAEYEKLRHEVVATETILMETLFGERAYAEVVLAS